MPKITLRRPSAAMLVAGTALVSSLTGPAVADEVARVAQSITSSQQIKNGSVTGADIKNDSVSTTDLRDGGVGAADIGTGQVQTSELGDNAIRGDKVQPNTIDSSDLQDNALRGPDVLDNSLTGADIDEGTLGKVPNAANADNAGNAGNADRLQGNSAADLDEDPRLVSFMRTMSRGDAPITQQVGTMTFTYNCTDGTENDAETRSARGGGGGTFPNTRAFIEVTSGTDDSYIAGNHGDSDSDFDAGETTEAVDNESTSANSNDNHDVEIYDAGSDFTFYDLELSAWTNTGGADCRFGGSAVLP